MSLADEGKTHDSENRQRAENGESNFQFHKSVRRNFQNAAHSGTTCQRASIRHMVTIGSFKLICGARFTARNRSTGFAASQPRLGLWSLGVLDGCVAESAAESKEEWISAAPFT